MDNIEFRMMAYMQALGDGADGLLQQRLQRLGSSLRVIRIAAQARLELLECVVLQIQLALALLEAVDVDTAAYASQYSLSTWASIARQGTFPHMLAKLALRMDFRHSVSLYLISLLSWTYNLTLRVPCTILFGTHLLAVIRRTPVLPASKMIT